MDYASPRAGYRSLLALASLYIAFAIGVFEHHVHISLESPTSFLNLFHHKCGWLAFLTLTWALSEGIKLLVVSTKPMRIRSRR